MTTTIKQPTLLLRIDSASYSQATIDFAVAMAAALQSHLHGQFIADENLLRAAALPFAREIAFPTAQPRSTSLATMQNALALQAAAFRRYIENAAAAANISCSYSYLQGRSRDLPGNGERPAWTIIGHAVSHAHNTTASTRPLQVLLLEQPQAQLLQALQSLSAQLPQRSLQLTLVTAAGSNGALRNALEANGPLPLQQINSCPADNLTTLLQQQPFDYIIAARSEPANRLQLLLEHSSGPLILVD